MSTPSPLAGGPVAPGTRPDHARAPSSGALPDAADAADPTGAHASAAVRPEEGGPAFDRASIERFVIEPAQIELSAGRLSVSLGCRLGPHRFCERFEWELGEIPVDVDELRPLADLLGLCTGTSYYKAAAPALVEVERQLTAAEIPVLGHLYDHGLREFAFTNSLPVPHRVSFGDTNGPITSGVNGVDAPFASRTAGPDDPPRSESGAPMLVPIGGGKDSALSLTIPESPLAFSVSPAPSMERTAAAVGRPLIGVRRHFDRSLLELNSRGALNGHVPITSITSVVASITAMIHSAGDVVMSVERSSSEPTRRVDGVEINHQHSKSVSFETDLAAAINTASDQRVRYWSLLRGLSELAITGLLVRRPHMMSGFLSCNRAFTVGSDRIDHWCLDCPKCRSTTVLFAPWMTPDQLSETFGGNLLADPAQTEQFRALIDPDLKPFECVGELAETALALTRLAADPTWADLAVVAALGDHARSMTGDLASATSRAFEFGDHRIPHPDLAASLRVELAELAATFWP